MFAFYDSESLEQRICILCSHKFIRFLSITQFNLTNQYEILKNMYTKIMKAIKRKNNYSFENVNTETSNQSLYFVYLLTFASIYVVIQHLSNKPKALAHSWYINKTLKLTFSVATVIPISSIFTLTSGFCSYKTSTWMMKTVGRSSSYSCGFIWLYADYSFIYISFALIYR